MSAIKLMIQPADVIAQNLFSGNIDVDNLKPMIFIAQTTHLKAFLGLKLYNKIYTGFVANNLAGEYLIIFNDYIKDLLCHHTSTLYINFGAYKVGETGIHKIDSENMKSLEASEIRDLGLQYAQLIAGVEANFKEYVSDKNLPELADQTLTIDTTFPWVM